MEKTVHTYVFSRKKTLGLKNHTIFVENTWHRDNLFQETLPKIYTRPKTFNIGPPARHTTSNVGISNSFTMSSIICYFYYKMVQLTHQMTYQPAKITLVPI